MPQVTEGALPKATCKVCSKVLSARNFTTTTLVRHLYNNHNDKRCEYEEKLLNRNKEKAARLARKLKFCDQPQIKESLEKINSLPSDSARAVAIKKIIIEMIILYYQPFAIVEDRGFKKLINFFEKRFVIPSRKYFSSVLLPKVFEEKKEKLEKILKKELEKAKYYSIGMTMDGWTSKSKEPFYSLTLHYLGDKFTARNWVLDCSNFPVSHTADAIWEKFKVMAHSWGIEVENEGTNVYVITDNAPAMKAAFANKNVTHIPCAAHTLQLAVDDSFKAVNREPILKKVRSGVTRYNHSNTSRTRLQNLQKQLNLGDSELVQMVDTRWNSQYIMLQKYVPLENALKLDLPNIQLSAQLTEDDWQLVKGVVSVLKPVYDATLELSRRNRPTFSMISPIVTSITTQVNAFLSNPQNKRCGVTFCRALHRCVNARFSYLNSHKEIHLATIIDPRYRTVLMTDQSAERAKMFLSQEANFMVNILGAAERSSIENQINFDPEEEEDETSICYLLNKRSKQVAQQVEPQHLSTLEKIKDEIDKFLNMVNIGPTDDPWEWWRANSTNFKFLTPVARRYLGIPGTSVESERFFSEAGQIVTARRCRLDPKNMSKLVFLHHNYTLLDLKEDPLDSTPSTNCNLQPA